MIKRIAFERKLFFRQGKAKIIDKAQFTNVNEHFETIFNAVMTQNTNRAKVYFSGDGRLHHAHAHAQALLYSLHALHE